MSDIVYPAVIKCVGGWFAVDKKGDVGSGPWVCEEAARAALNHGYEKAHLLERQYLQNAPNPRKA